MNPLTDRGEKSSKSKFCSRCLSDRYKFVIHILYLFDFTWVSLYDLFDNKKHPNHNMDGLWDGLHLVVTSNMSLFAPEFRPNTGQIRKVEFTGMKFYKPIQRSLPCSVISRKEKQQSGCALFELFLPHLGTKLTTWIYSLFSSLDEVILSHLSLFWTL